MDKYIKELLSLKNSVVLPGLGGLLKIGKNISINEYLKFNDGKLVAYISEQKNIDSEEALKEVEAYCNDVKAKLESEGKYTIKKLGTIKLADGKLSFEIKSKEEKVQEEPVSIENKEEKPEIEEKLEEVSDVKENMASDSKDLVAKDETKQKQVIISDSSSDLNEDDALEAIRKIDNKEELIAFAENDKRDSVSSFFLERLTYFNELKEEKKKAKEEVVKKKEQKEEETIEAKTEGKKKEIETPNEVSVEETKTEKIVKEEVIVEEKKEVPSEKRQEFVENTDETKEEIPDETIEKITEGAEKIEKESKKRRKSRPFLWIGLVLIISGAGILGYLKKDMIKGWFSAGEIAVHEEDKKSNETSKQKMSNEDLNEEVIVEEETNDQEENVVAAEEVEETTVPEEEPIVEENKVEEPEEVTSTPVQSTENGNYHVIVGSFSNVNNAENLVKDLKAEGYVNAGILGKFGRLTSVKIGSYSSIKEAKSALQQSGKDGWIKKY